MPRTFYVGAGYDRVRVYGVYREDGGEAGYRRIIVVTTASATGSSPRHIFTM